MLKKVTHTIITRFINLLGAFFIVVLNSHFLGTTGQGDIALINFGILLTLSMSNFIGGGAASYLVPRKGAAQLILPAYAWAFFSAGIFYLLFSFFNIVPKQYVFAIGILAFMHSLFSFHMVILIGEEKITKYNILQIVQIFGLLFFLLIYYFVVVDIDVWSFIKSSFLSFSLVLLLSTVYIRKHYQQMNFRSFKNTFISMFDLGKYAQTSNVFQLLNYRLNIFFLETLLIGSRGLVGIYSVGMNVSDAVLNFGRSLSLVQYSKILNQETEEEKNVILTILFFKLSIGITFLLLLFVNLLPEEFYLIIFGNGFTGIKTVVNYMSIGVLALSGTMIFSHYKSGRGLYHYNTKGSAIALIGTLIAGYFLISAWNLKGAAISFSIAMTLQLTYHLVVFLRIGNVNFKELLIHRGDILMIKEFFNKEKSK